jgi:hypothetical protein
MTVRWPLVLVMGLLAAVAAAQDASALKSDKDKVSYALGVNLATQLRAMSVEVDPDVLSRGLKDALSSRETLLSNEEVRDVVAGLQKELRAKQTALRSARIRAGREVVEKNGTAQAAGLGREEPARISVSFKMDPRIATGNYGGERWVSPPTYTRVGEGKACTVEARVQGSDATGRSVSFSPKWTSADPEMVTVTPNDGNQVKILVLRPGQSSVRVISQAVSKELTIKAAYQNNVLRVDISQK